MKLTVIIPNHGFGDMSAGPLLYAQQRCPQIEGNLELMKFTGSGITQNHNMGLCEAINRFYKGQLTHALFMHSDVQPQGPEWLSLLIEQFELSRADLLGCFIPMKNPLGLTSTAWDTDYWRPQRVTLHQAKRLPVTWTADNLLLNTGLLLVDLAKLADLDPPPYFTFRDRIVRKRSGEWTWGFVGEDWDFSRQCRNAGLRLCVTRVLNIHHAGHQLYPSAPAWGESSDIWHVQAREPISIMLPGSNDVDNQQMIFDARAEIFPDGS